MYQIQSAAAALLGIPYSEFISNCQESRVPSSCAMSFDGGAVPATAPFSRLFSAFFASS